MSLSKKQSTKYKSTLQEKLVSKEIKGKPVIASGAFWSAKGDSRSENFLVECKTTEKNSYRLTFTVWNKIRREAIRDGLRTPVMCVDLQGGATRMAVFEKTSLLQYENYYNYWPGTNVYLETSKSFLITGENKTITLSNCKVNNNPVILSVIPWSTFLNIIDGGAKCH